MHLIRVVEYLNVFMTSATKVSELFAAAGEAFTKLAELAQIIQSSLSNAHDENADDFYANYNSNSSWTPEDTELLQLAVKRFGDDLNILSEHIKDKTMCQIKSTFKKIQSNTSNKADDSNAPTNQYSNSTTKMESSFEELNNLRVPAADRSGLPLAILNSTSEPLSSSLIGTKNSMKQSNTTNSAISTSSVLSTQINNTAVTASSSSTTSICPSPSPFLHYPLLRKSADITLNMLNARDDSDDEERKAGLSVFNSS